EKYVSLARDATSAGDRVAAEAYFQHAEHYFRILSDSTDPNPSGRRQDDRPPQNYGNNQNYGSDAANFGDEDDDGELNGHGGQQRAHEGRGSGNQPQQGHRDAGPRESGERDSGQRDSGPRDSGQGESGRRETG